jgi:hypothetical protein
MTLREESGTGPPAEPVTGADPPAEPVIRAGPPAHPAGSGGTGTGRPPRPRRSRAALLIALAAAGLIGLGSLAAVLVLHGRGRATPAALPSVFGLRAGQCVNSGPGGVSAPTVVPCNQAHDAEVYARFALAGARWPGAAGIGALARRGCTARLGTYLNPQLASAVLAESYVFPDHGAWNAGERTVICEIRGTAGKLTGSVRGLG